MSNAESLVKRRGSPLASEEPNPKRTEADSSLVTQLFNDKFIKGLACVLAFDENIVGMAEKLLRDAKSEHGSFDLDAWEEFTSLPFWQSDKFIEYPTKMGPKQQHLHQQIQETKARISDDPSLKPFFAGKDHIRVVLVLVILFWSREKDDGTGFIERSEDFEDSDEEDVGCCAYYKKSVDHLRKSLPCEDEKKMMNNFADELIKDPNIVEIFLELLGKVCSVSPQGAQEHFCKVKEVWGNHKFIDHLLKFEYGLRPRAQENSNIRLSIFVRSLIKKDPLFEVISGYDDPAFRMRAALSILIGFWSNHDLIPPLIYTMGGDALE